MFKYLFISLLILGAKTCNKKADKTTEEVKSTQEIDKTMKASDAVLRLHDIWALEGMLEKEIDTSAFPMGVPTLEIFVEDARIGGFAGCNNYNAQINAVDETSFELGNIAATKKMCQNGIFGEQLYLNLLSKASTYKLEEMKLHLIKNDSVLLSFKKID